MKYKGVKTESWSQPVLYRKWWEFWKPETTMGKGIHTIYYEKAFDYKGKGLMIGDRVKVLETGKIHTIQEIFQGNLRLEVGYCQPSKVLALGGNHEK